MIARQACYHEYCMAKLRNKFFNDQENHVKGVQKSFGAIALAECMSFIEYSLQSSDEVAPFVTFSVIRKFYCHCLQKLKEPIDSVNATRMKVNLLKLNPNLEAASRKKQVFISFKDDLATALEYSQEHSLQNNATHLSRAAHIIRNEIFEKHWHFTGSFTDTCQNESVLALFLSLIHVITGSSYDPNS